MTKTTIIKEVGDDLDLILYIYKSLSPSNSWIWWNVLNFIFHHKKFLHRKFIPFIKLYNKFNHNFIGQIVRTGYLKMNSKNILSLVWFLDKS